MLDVLGNGGLTERRRDAEEALRSPLTTEIPMIGSRLMMAPLGAVLLASCSRGAPAAPPVKIAQVRAAAVGSPVTVEGIVSVPSGLIDAGFAITDGEAGIHVAADSTTRFAAGDRVRVTGTRAEVRKMASVSPTRVERLGKGTPPPPKTVRTGEIGEATEGLVVKVSGRALTPIVQDLPYGYKIWVDDGSGRVQLFLAKSGGDFGLDRLLVNSTITATGISAQYNDVYEVLPVSRADVAASGGLR